MPDLTELDRLIEEGLTLYGQGDLDGALLVWERALAMDPENAQANSYVDYVRMNYEMLTTDAGQDQPAPFGIADDEPEYQIEIMPGEVKDAPSGPPMYMDPKDEGWFMEREPQKRVAQGTMPPPTAPASAPPARTAPDDAPSEENLEVTNDLELDMPQTLELEADEPPEPAKPVEPAQKAGATAIGKPAEKPAEKATDRPTRAGSEGMSFDDATHEYAPSESQKLARAERVARQHEADIGDLFSPEAQATDGGATTEFHPERTPGFESATEVKKRDLGFVKAAEAKELEQKDPDPDELPAPPVRPRRMSQEPPELKMTLRTPDAKPGEPAEDAEPEPPQIALSYDTPDDDLIDSLPSPKPSHITRDLPSKIVPPASTTPPPVRMSIESFELGEPELPPDVSVSFHAPSAAPTTAPTTAPAAAPPRSATPTESPSTPAMGSPTRDFSEKPTQDITNRPPPEPDPLVSAPTRELGLRPEGSRRALTEDEPTGAKTPLDPAKILGADAGTRSDIVLPFDPIDARTRDILAELDRGAPADEQKDDRTRRRITSLLERAVEWSKGDDLERAVAATDLALSEDPGSALAQKLIHRNRDAILSVFTAFLGDLNRQPILARPLHELASAPISPRAAFLLSRVDGTLSLDEILDVSGMPRLEAVRYLCQLFLRGILR